MPTRATALIGHSDHAVQFYEKDVFLIAEVTSYLQAGLSEGESVIVVATAQHRAALSERLSEHLHTSRYIQLDASDTLAQFLSNGMPDPELFRTLMVPLVRQAAGAGNGRVRIFGEMVALLWEAGHVDAAIRLESFWNDLAAEFSFSLLCAYKIGEFAHPDHGRAFQQICAAHSIAAPAETLIPNTRLTKETAWAFTLFQQKSYALDVEVGRREQLELKLRQREQELADFLENAVECVHQVAMDGTVLWANKAELTLLGYEAQEYIGHHITEFHADAPAISDILARLSRGETIYNYPAQLRCKDGSIKDVLIHSNGRWEDGIFRYTRCFTRDVTDRKRFEDELERQVAARTSALVASQHKLRALATELGLAEHRIRKDMAAELHDYLAQLLIVVHLKLVQAGRIAVRYPGLADLLKESSETIQEAIRYTRSLMADLHPPVLSEGLPGALRWLAHKFQSYQLRVEVDIPESLVLKLSEDQTSLLFQSVRELLMNVVKHARTDHARLTIWQSGTELYIEVSDTGVGFVHKGVLTEDSTKHEATKFGLFSIRERLEALEGRFDIHSAPSQGTRARLVLPIIDETTVQVQADNRSTSKLSRPLQSSHRSDTLRVVLVDDHAMVRQGLRSVLEMYSDITIVAEAGDGEEAVRQVSACLPDVVIMDMNLPICDGIEATKRIKADYPDMVVIGLSVHQATDVESALKAAGGAAYVTKESATDCLYATIREAVQQS